MGPQGSQPQTHIRPPIVVETIQQPLEPLHGKVKYAIQAKLTRSLSQSVAHQPSWWIEPIDSLLFCNDLTVIATT